jgi:hypothetical protein
MYVNTKIISVETIPGIREGRYKEEWRVGALTCDIFDIS